MPTRTSNGIAQFCNPVSAPLSIIGLSPGKLILPTRGAWGGLTAVTALRKRCACPGWRCDHWWFADFRVRGRRYRIPLETGNKNLADQLATVERTNLLKAKAGIFQQKDITFGEFTKTYL